MIQFHKLHKIVVELNSHFIASVYFLLMLISRITHVDCFAKNLAMNE